MLTSTEVVGQEMIDLVRKLKAEGAMVVAVEVGSRASHWIVEYYPKEDRSEQSELFGS